MRDQGAWGRYQEAVRSEFLRFRLRVGGGVIAIGFVVHWLTPWSLFPLGLVIFLVVILAAG